MQSLRIASVAGLLGLFVTVAAGCPGPTGTTNPLPSITSFTATPATIPAGQATTLAWTTKNATSITISDSAGNTVDVSGQPATAGSVDVVITDPGTVTYTLMAVNADNKSVSKEVTVTVSAPPVISSFTATPASIMAGDTATLAWTTTGADSITIVDDQGNTVDTTGATAASGSVTVTPAATATYTLTATGAGGSVTMDATVTVQTGPAIVSFTGDNTAPVLPGTAVALTWQTTGAASLILSDDQGNRIVDTTAGTLCDSGNACLVDGDTLTVNPAQQVTYTLTATDAGGATATATVTVEVLAAVSTFTATPGTVRAGDTVTLAWTTGGAVSATITGPDAFSYTVPSTDLASGTTTATVNTAGDFTLTVTGAGGNTNTATATVALTTGPLVSSFTATPSDVSVGGTVTLTWVVAGATSIALDLNGTAIDVSANNPAGDTITQTMSAAGAAVFTLTATNANGTDSATANVNVVAPATVDSFVAVPSRVPSGGSTTLTWATTGATAIRLEKDGADVGATATDVNGTFTDTVAANATYILYAINAVGTETASSPVTVTVGAPANTSFTSSATMAAPGDVVTLSWTNDGGTTLSIADSTGTAIAACGSTSPAVVASGSCDVTLPATPGSETYTLTVSDGAGGSATATLTITISDGPIIRSFTASASAITVGDPVDLTWAVSNAAGQTTPPTLALVDDQGNTYDVSLNNANADTFTITPTVTGTYTFTLTASDPSATTTDTATVIVDVVAAPQITAFAANPPSLDTQGGTVSPTSTLSWTTTGGSMLEISLLDATGTPVTPAIYTAATQPDIDGASYVVTPPATTTYRLHMENAAGAIAEQDVTVIVDGASVDTFTATDPIGTVSSTSVDIIAGESATLDWTTSRANSVTLTPLPPTVTESTGGFMDISTSSTAVQATLTNGTTDTGEYAVTFPAGFTFPFYGTPRTAAVAMTDGFLSFDTTQTSTFLNPSLPSGTARGGVIAPFWNDLDATATGQVWTDSGTDASGQYVVLMWKGFQLYGGTTDDLNFEVVLHDNGNIDFHYGTMTATPQSAADGANATIGYEDDTGSNAFQYSFVTAVTGGLTNKDIVIAMPNPPLSGSQTVSPTATTTYTLTATNTKGTDTKQVTVVVHPAVVINTSGVNPAQPDAGQSFDVTWTATNATQVVVTDPTGTVICTVTDPTLVNNGTCPSVQATAGSYAYTITATGALPRDTTTATDTIQVYNPLVINSWTADGASQSFIATGGSSVLAWDVTGAAGIKILDQANTDITPPSPGATGTLTVSPVTTTTYTLYISDDPTFASGSRIRQMSVTVYVNAAAVTTFGASSTEILPSGSTTLSWTTTNATSVGLTPQQISVATTTGNTFSSIQGMPGSTELTPANYDSALVSFTAPNGFTFPYLGGSYTSFNISTNGWVQMGTTATYAADLNGPLPSTSSPTNIIAPYWADLDGSGTATPHITYMLNGAPPNRTLTIEWTNFQEYGVAGTMTFQVVLHENGDFEIHYLTMQAASSTDQPDYNGAIASVGFDDAAGTAGYQILYTTADTTLVGNGIGHTVSLGLPTTGSTTVSPTGTTTYQLCATGGGYTDCKTVTVLVINPGDIMVNEIMANPAAVADASGEWFELANTTSNAIDINGWTISDAGTDSFTIAAATGSLIVPAGGYVVLGNNNNTATNGGVTEDYSYGTSMSLANSADEIIVTFSGTQIDQVAWDSTWSIPAGASLSLGVGAASGDPTANDLATSWCPSVTAMTGGDMGTPGAANDGLCGLPLSVTHMPALAIPDATGSASGCGHVGAVSDVIPVPAALNGMSITDVNVGIDITHTYDADLDIFVEYTDGTGTSTCVALSTGNGSSGNDYTGTIFDDQATTAITAGSAPFTGSYTPQSPLSALNGLALDGGTFTIWVSDSTGGDVGTLNTWSVTAAY